MIKTFSIKKETAFLHGPSDYESDALTNWAMGANFFWLLLIS